MTALSIMRLLPEPMARIAGGSVRLDGRDLVALPEREMRSVRGADIAMIFQEPMTSLNPVLSIGHQLTEAIRAHRAAGRGEARRSPSRRSPRSGSASRSGGSASIRTNCRAACASG